MRRTLAAAVAAVAPLVLAAPPVHADGGTLASYRVVAQGAGLNWTYDSPTSSFHPQADNELPYAEVDADPTRSHALSSVYWPGAAGGNLGTLIAVLGGPMVSALNDPVRAEASTSSTTQQTTTTPVGTTMKASVVPESGDLAQEGTAAGSWAGLPLGQAGSIGAISAVAKHTLDKRGNLVATARNSVADIDLGGMFRAGAITSSATEQSAGGAAPSASSTMTVQNLTIGGQKAYVDGSGVHMGEPGKPPSSAVTDGVSKGLAGAGMQIYFTTPEKVTIGGVSYDYAPSLLVYWAPTGDTNHDVFTFGFGGAAIGMIVSGGAAQSSAGGGTDVGSLGGEGGGSSPSVPLTGAATVPPSPGSTTLQLPAPASGGTRAPRTATRRGSQPLAGGQLASAKGPAGIGGWWFVLLAIAALAGIAVLSRLPALLNRAAAPDCVRERPTPIRRL